MADGDRRIEQLSELVRHATRSVASLARALETSGDDGYQAAALPEIDDDLSKELDNALRALSTQVAQELERARWLDHYHDSSMELAIGLSEAFDVLARLRGGDLDARVSGSMLLSQHELVAKLGEAINATACNQGETFRRQQEALQELSNPILRVWDGVLVVPIIGTVSSERTAEIMDRLLEQVVSSQSKCVIIDITGVKVVDTRTADDFIKMVKAAELVGARCVLTGITPAVAQTLIDIGVDLGPVVTLRNLQAGLSECIRFLESREET